MFIFTDILLLLAFHSSPQSLLPHDGLLLLLLTPILDADVGVIQQYLVRLGEVQLACLAHRGNISWLAKIGICILLMVPIDDKIITEKEKVRRRHEI